MKRINWLVVYRVTVVTLLAVIAWQAVKIGRAVFGPGPWGGSWHINTRS